jgi:DNA-binding NarL/FixJ family response regulator
VKPRLRILLVEDHPLVREAVRGVLDAGEMQVVGEAATPDGALSQALVLRPDVVVLDVDLRGESAVPIISELRRRLPEATVVILTASTSDRLVVEAVEAGARGFLTKDMDGETLRRSIIGAARGELAMTRRRSRLVTDHLAMRRERSPLELGLTDRELEIIRMVAEGLTDREIAEALVLSRRTVEGHVARLIHKLGSRNRTEAAARYRSLT